MLRRGLGHLVGGIVFGSGRISGRPHHIRVPVQPSGLWQCPAPCGMPSPASFSSPSACSRCHLPKLANPLYHPFGLRGDAPEIPDQAGHGGHHGPGSLRIAVLVGLALSQIGEFSFVLSKVGLEYGLISQELYRIFLDVAVLTMVANILYHSGITKLADATSRLPVSRG